MGTFVMESRTSADLEKELLLGRSKNGKAELDDALDRVGVGFFHFLLVIVSGWALASDSVEVQCVSFVTPQLTDREANPDEALRPTNVRYPCEKLVMVIGFAYWLPNITS